MAKETTAVEWLIENLMINGLIRLTKEQHGLYKELTGLAKQMENERLLDKYGEGYDEGMYDALNK